MESYEKIRDTFFVMPENGIETSDANIKVYNVIVNVLYFLKANFPKIEYSAYPNPAPRPIAISINDMLSSPVILEIKTHHIKVNIIDIILVNVIFSLNNITDIIITKIGAVYKSMAAIDKEVNLIDVK